MFNCAARSEENSNTGIINLEFSADKISGLIFKTHPAEPGKS